MTLRLHLFALTFQGRHHPQEIERLLVTLTGSHRPILDYLVTDVLAAQPESLQTFVLQTSLLSRLTAALCDAITGSKDSDLLLVLKALAHFTHWDLKAARQSLRAALVLAQPEGYQRLFLDEGEPMAALLQAVLPDLREVPLVTYGGTLLRALLSERPGMDTSALAASAPLLEPLSPQEGRVLRLLASGHSNPEITRELVVSVNTVKAHVKSIYRKLNVHSRWEAREAARHLKLL